MVQNESAAQAPSNFRFLADQWPTVFAEAKFAERYALRDPRGCLLYVRRALEQTVDWLYSADSKLRVPLKDDLNNRLTEPRFQDAVPVIVRDKMHALRKLSNNGVHGNSPVSAQISMHVVAELFHITIWLATFYSAQTSQRPAPGTKFDPKLLAPRPPAGVVQLTKSQAEKLSASLGAKDKELKAAAQREADYEAKIAALQAQIEGARKANEKIPDQHDYTESGTRIYIDLYLAQPFHDVPADR